MKKMNEYNPETVIHPGKILVDKLNELGMGKKEFAIRVSKPEKTITAVTKGESSITPDMAVRFEDVLSIPARFWLTLQRNFDEVLARNKRMEVIDNSIEWAKSFPYAAMAKLGWVDKTRNVKEKVLALFNFFGVSDYSAWESYYFKQELKVSFRISLAHLNESYAIAAWLRRGEIQAREISCLEYSSETLKRSLPEIKKVMARHPNDFFERLKSICSKAGIKVVHTPCLPKAPIHGSSRWLGDNPLIQLSARYKTNDIFWFTVFHEIGHILLHGKKYISIENVEYSEMDKVKEREADNFAIQNTFTVKEEVEVLRSLPITIPKIKMYAKKFNTHPALILGRLQKIGYLHYGQGRELIERIELN